MSDAVVVPNAAGSPRADLLPRAGFTDTASVLLQVFLPTILKGVILRRPAMLALAEWLDFDKRAVRALQRLRRHHGSGPVLLNLPGRSLALVLDPGDADRVLRESPEPFSTATPEKRAALAHFEPKVSLISEGPERVDRRRYNDQVLESHRQMHALAAQFLAVVAEETGCLRRKARARGGMLDWDGFAEVWFRIVRRIVLGNAAAEDNELSRLMARLRYAGNWAFLRPEMRRSRAALLARIQLYLHRAEENSLAAAMATVPASSVTAPEQQVPQWLFAFDAAGMTAFRAMALLASHPDQAAAVQAEVRQRTSPGPEQTPRLRATLLEAVRLWPTSPLILRESKSDTPWRNGRLPADTGVVIFAPFFHRDDERLPYANRFDPEVWMGKESAQPSLGLIPFSAGPGECPGRNIVLLLTSALLADLFADETIALRSHRGRLTPDKPLPGTLNHFRLRFQLA